MQPPEQALEKYLREKGIRKSEQRTKVFEIFLNTERHLTANELYEIARKKYPKIGYATVYRAIKIIAEAGIAEEIEFGDRVKRFEHKYGHEHHDHLICLKCGRFVEAMNPQIEKLQKKLARDNDFTLLRHKMHLFGICGKCNKKKKRK